MSPPALARIATGGVPHLLHMGVGTWEPLCNTLGTIRYDGDIGGWVAKGGWGSPDRLVVMSFSTEDGWDVPVCQVCLRRYGYMHQRLVEHLRSVGQSWGGSHAR